jgi:hypothetical protein
MTTSGGKRHKRLGKVSTSDSEQFADVRAIQTGEKSPPKAPGSHARARQKSREWVRRMRRAEALKREDAVVRLDDHEAAEYLGISLRLLRSLVSRGVLRYFPETHLFDTDELQDYMLSRARTPEERHNIILRRVRWEAHDLEQYPLTLRVDSMEGFARIWEQLAERFEADGFDEEASAVRTILRQARERLRQVSIEN